MRKSLATLSLSAMLTSPLAAQDDPATLYVEANLLSIFYHEFGHAIIDVMGLPILGQEEDAADTISVLLIDAFNDEASAQSILVDAAYGFLDEDADSEEGTPWWDVHGHDLQRYYNMVCQFYGGDPDAREDLAEDLELPEDRAETCEEEFDLAYDSFDPILTELFDAAPGTSIQYQGGVSTLTEKLISDEVAAFNQSMALPEGVTISVTVEPCDEANAFYDLDARSIIMCSELEAHLRRLYAQNQ